MKFFILLLIYFVGVLSVGIFFSKKLKNLEDFFLASRMLPTSLVFLSLAASWLGASSTLVAVDEAYREGVSSFWIMGMPAVLTVIVFALFLAGPIRRLPTVSLPDLVEIYYGRSVRHLAAVLIVWYMVLLASSQMVALGNFLEAFLGTSYLYGLLLGTGVVLVYSAFGGFFSVVVTDGLQFFLLVGGIAGLFAYLSGEFTLKEISSATEQLGKAEYFHFFLNIKRNAIITLSFLLAWIISPIAWQRIQAAKTEKIARRSLWMSSGAFFLFYWGIVFIGMLSFPLFFKEVPEGHVLTTLIISQKGFVFGGVVFVAIVAAVMSTMDTAINTGALSCTRDIYQQLFPLAKEKELVFVSRFSTILLGGLAFLIATRVQSILKTLGLASEIMAEGFFIPGIAMIILKKKWPSAGLLSIVLGGGYSVAGFLCEMKVLPLSWPEWPYSVPYGLLAGLSGFVLGALYEEFIKKWLS